jgi:hypothetical protein
MRKIPDNQLSGIRKQHMRVLIYKRTHTGDPDESGVFGVHDCMGRVRALNYDAVIGVGGIGAEPVQEGIDSKITWIGIHPIFGPIHGRGPLVTFEHFLLFDQGGPEFGAWAPRTAKRFYGRRVRYLIHELNPTEKSELNDVIDWAVKNGCRSKGSTVAKYKGVRVKCISCPPGRKKKGVC